MSREAERDPPQEHTARDGVRDRDLSAGCQRSCAHVGNTANEPLTALSDPCCCGETLLSHPGIPVKQHLHIGSGRYVQLCFEVIGGPYRTRQRNTAIRALPTKFGQVSRNGDEYEKDRSVRPWSQTIVGKPQSNGQSQRPRLLLSDKGVGRHDPRTWDERASEELARLG
jgi:hypothetical protein